MGELIGLEIGEIDCRVYLFPQDLLRRLLGDLLDLHAAFGRRHDDVAAHRSVEEDGEVELTFDVDALLQVEPVDDLALRAGLDR